MKSLRRQGILTVAEAISRFVSEPWKNCSSVGTGRPLPLEGCGKATRRVGQGLALERGEIGRRFALRDDERGVRKNILEMRGERPAHAAGRRGGHEAILEEM